MKLKVLLTEEDSQMLKEIAEVKRFPIVRFELRSSKDESLRSIALPNVRITKPDDTMELVRERGDALQRLKNDGCVILDFHPAAVVAADYAVYKESALYAQLCEAAEEGKKRPDFLFDIPWIKKGRAVLTEKGFDTYRSLRIRELHHFGG